MEENPIDARISSSSLHWVIVTLKIEHVITVGSEVIYLQHAHNPERNRFMQNTLKAPLKT